MVALEQEQYFDNPPDEQDEDLFDVVQDDKPFWDAGRYLFVVSSVNRNPEPSRYTKPDGRPGDPTNIWQFEVYWPEDGSPVRLEADGSTVCLLRQFISNSMTSSSRGRPLIEAIIGRRLEDDDAVRKSDLVGKKFFGMISNEAPRDNPRGKKSAKLINPEKFVAPRARQVPRMASPIRAAAQLEEVEDLPF